MMKRLFMVLMVLLLAGVTSNVYGGRAQIPKCTDGIGLSMDISPKAISARKNQPVDLMVTGSVTVPKGCKLTGLTYTLEDEYGEIGSDEPKKVVVGTDGSFTISEKVNASRKGEDKDGRNYTITVTATDATGKESSQGFVVTVGHDNRGGNSDAAKSK